jgi:hypothetical protein
LANRFVFLYSLVALTIGTPETSLASGSCRMDLRLSALLKHDRKTKIEHSERISARKNKIGIQGAGASWR